MRVLLDTHVVLWALAGSSRLSKPARQVIEHRRNEILVSAVSAWEIAIKKALGRIQVPDDLEDALEDAGFTKVSLGFAAATALERLPAVHQDPFDRMLIAQALQLGVPLVSADRNVARYPLQILW